MPTFDFGNGPVPAHRHPNGGGWVADTATVSETAFARTITLHVGPEQIQEAVQRVRQAQAQTNRPPTAAILAVNCPITVAAEARFGAACRTSAAHPPGSRADGWAVAVGEVEYAVDQAGVELAEAFDRRITNYQPVPSDDIDVVLTPVPW